MITSPRIPADRICLLRLGAFGDTIHAISMINGLRQLYPDAHLSWILDPVPHEIAKEQPEVDDFIVFRRGSGLAGWRELRHRLRERPRFDLLLVPQVSLRSSLVSLLVDARIRLGLDWNRSREGHWCFVNRHLPPGDLRHAQDLFLEFLDYLRLESYEPEWNLRFTADEIERERDFFAAIGAPVLALVVASSTPDKDWDTAGYAAVADQARARFGLAPMLLGGPSVREREIAADISSRMSSEPVVALEGPVREMLWKLHGSRVVVAPDTGPLHAAVAMNRPTVGLYGYSDPRRCGPYRRFHDLLIDAWADPSTGEKISRRKKRERMSGITPDQVLEKIALALERYP